MLDLDFISGSLNVRPVQFGAAGASPEPLDGFSIDSRTVRPKSCFIAIPGQKFNGHDFLSEVFRKGVRCFIAEKKYKNKVKKEGREGSVFLVRDTVASLASLAHQYKTDSFSTVIALTGSSGKTTTRELIVSMLSKKYNVHTAKKNYNNEIGLPLTILEAPSNTHLVVLEMGMNHSGEIRKLSEIAQPLLGMITNVGYAHIGHFGGLESIADVKAEIFRGIMPHSFALLNRDDIYFNYLRKLSPVEVMDFGIADLNVLEDKGLDGYRLEYRGRQFLYHLPGRHNLSNLCGALRVADFFKVDLDDRIRAVESVDAVSGRSEVVRKGVTIINDCYNANPSSMAAGLEMLAKTGGRRVAVLADMLELGKLSQELHAKTGDLIARIHAADIVFAYGEHSAKLVDTVKQNSSIPAFWFETRGEMIHALLSEDGIKNGDTVLVKASNGMKLDEAVRALSEKF